MNLENNQPRPRHTFSLDTRTAPIQENAEVREKNVRVQLLVQFLNQVLPEMKEAETLHRAISFVDDYSIRYFTANTDLANIKNGELPWVFPPQELLRDLFLRLFYGTRYESIANQITYTRNDQNRHCAPVVICRFYNKIKGFLFSSKQALPLIRKDAILGCLNYHLIDGKLGNIWDELIESEMTLNPSALKWAVQRLIAFGDEIDEAIEDNSRSEEVISVLKVMLKYLTNFLRSYSGTESISEKLEKLVLVMDSLISEMQKVVNDQQDKYGNLPRFATTQGHKIKLLFEMYLKESHQSIIRPLDAKNNLVAKPFIAKSEELGQTPRSRPKSQTITEPLIASADTSSNPYEVGIRFYNLTDALGTFMDGLFSSPYRPNYYSRPHELVTHPAIVQLGILLTNENQNGVDRTQIMIPDLTARDFFHHLFTGTIFEERATDENVTALVEALIRVIRTVEKPLSVLSPESALQLVNSVLIQPNNDMESMLFELKKEHQNSEKHTVFLKELQLLITQLYDSLGQKPLSVNRPLSLLAQMEAQCAYLLVRDSELFPATILTFCRQLHSKAVGLHHQLSVLSNDAKDNAQKVRQSQRYRLGQQLRTQIENRYSKD